MKSAAIPQIRVEPALREQVDAVLAKGETISGFVEAAVRRAVEYRRVQAAFETLGEAAWQKFQRDGVAIPAEEVLQDLQARLDAKRRKLASR